MIDMEKCIILRYGELVLRGANRRKYEDVLEKNVRNVLAEHGVKAVIKRFKGKMIIFTDFGCSFLRRVFGVVSVSSAYRVARDADKINLAVKSFGSVKTRIKFADKTKEDEVLVKKIESDGEKTVNVDIYPDHVFVYDSKERAAEGLPVGSEGKVGVIIKDGDGVLAALLMMKRGCEVVPVVRGTVDISLLSEFGFCGEPADDLEGLKSLDLIIDTSSGYGINPIIGMSDDEKKEVIARFRSLSRTYR